MKNKINFHTKQFAATDEKKWLPKAARGIFLKKAEEDYVACRVLYMLNLVDPAFYHLHQYIEKYLKAYILDRGIHYHKPTCNKTLCQCLIGHKLEKWAEICGKDDVFFQKKQLIDDLTKLSFMVELPRYPQDKFQEWGGSPFSLIKFLDEFVFEMRQKIVHLQYADAIAKKFKTDIFQIIQH